MSTTPRLPAALLLLALGAAACGGGATSSPSTPGSETPAPPAASPVNPTTVPSPVIEGIAHPTGAGEIVLRLDEAGGFTPPEWQAARIPYFTLYGDGRVVFIQTTATMPERSDNVFVGMPLRTARLNEDQVQELLGYALKEGGLAIARESYDNPMVADAPSSIFTINADDDTRTVNVMALGMDNQPGPDTAVLRQLATLGDLLRNFDQGGSAKSDPYVATAYRAVILEQQGGVEGVQVRDWPWEDIKSADFTLPKDVNALPQGTRTLTPEQVAAVGVEPFENGVSSGIWIRSDDGKLYSLVIRPLLPDEKA